MAEGLNRVMLLGNLGADPELRYGQSQDTAVLRLRVATTEGYYDRRSNERKERTDWHNVVVFGKRAEALQKILSKGSMIFVEGRLQTSSYEKDGRKIYKTDVVATNLILAGGRGRAEPPAGKSPPPKESAGPSERNRGVLPEEDGRGGGGPPLDDEDIPF